MHENNHLHAHSALSRIRNYLGSHSLRYFAGAIAVILAVVTMMLPSAYTVERADAGCARLVVRLRCDQHLRR